MQAEKERTERPTSSQALPEVPLVLDGASMLHQMFRIRWAAWNALSSAERAKILSEAATELSVMEKGVNGQSACFSMLGHKGDLMFVHVRPDFVGLKETELRLARLRLNEFLEPTHSYVSIVELGLYESTPRLYNALTAQGIEPHSPDWKKGIDERLEQQKKAMAPRLHPEIPPRRYVCFYPMDRKRGEDKNWYQVPMAERQRMMHEHGMIGRRYADEVKQIITGSIGFDDWEWGVTLFADQPNVFKQLIYEMRFDEVSAVYALFGQFYVGLRFPAAEIASLFDGRLPAMPEAHVEK